jgi:cytoskeletal protein CcmA (bactofilin family)
VHSIRAEIKDVRIEKNVLTINGEQKRLGLLSLSSSTKPSSLLVPAAASDEATTMSDASNSPVLPVAGGPATIGKSLTVKGEVIGSESLYIDGKVEGAINLPSGRMTVSRYAQVSADISARDVVVLGKVCGNISAIDRVDIRSEASVIGNVIAQRISVGDGACFEGGIHVGGEGKRKDG